jgi:hypothetical protein
LEWVEVVFWIQEVLLELVSEEFLYNPWGYPIQEMVGHGVMDALSVV